MHDFSREDHEQLAMLLGYSVSGAGDLGYFSKKRIAEADEQVEALIAKKGRKAVIATAHDCPACFSAAGEPCTTTEGAEMSRVHYARGQLAGMGPAEVLAGCRADPMPIPGEMVRLGGDDLRIAIALARAAVDRAEQLGASPSWCARARRIASALEQPGADGR